MIKVLELIDITISPIVIINIIKKKGHNLEVIKPQLPKARA